MFQVSLSESMGNKLQEHDGNMVTHIDQRCWRLATNLKWSMILLAHGHAFNPLTRASPMKLKHGTWIQAAWNVQL